MKRHTDGFRDLYRILQVDHLAEPEVIEGAYKRLSRKYHPDTNKDTGAEAKMKLINQAYQILSDPEKRREYDLIYRQRLEERNKAVLQELEKPEQLMVRQATDVLQGYFSGLASGAFEAAYALVSDEDKKYISKADFLEWQKTVTGLYEIGDFHFVPFKTLTGKETGTKGFSHIFEFQVSLAERERSSGKVNNTEFSRWVVREKNELKMYLGYRDIQAIIAKFKQLAKGKAAPEDNSFDKPKLCKEIEREMARADRYSRPFSVILLETCLPEDTGSEIDYETVLATIIREIGCNLRRTDYCGRWGRNRIMVILPETRIFSAAKTAEKIFNIIRELKFNGSSEPPISFCAGLAQYKQSSLQEYLDLLISNVLAAKNRGKWRVIY